eukprot:s2561_g4.t1
MLFVLHSCPVQELCRTKVIGVPHSKNLNLYVKRYMPLTLGFDTARRLLSEVAGNIFVDSLSSNKYWHFIRCGEDLRSCGACISDVLWCQVLTMGRQAHHISDSQKETLTQTVNNLCEVVQSRRRSGRYSGVVLISRQLLETLASDHFHCTGGQDQLKTEIAAIVKAEAADKNRQPFPTEVDSRLKSDATKALFKRLPRFVQMSMIRNRDSSGLPVLPKDLEAERILGRFVQQELRNQPPVKKVKATFAPRFHAMDLMTSSPLPSAFDCAFGYALGHTAALLVNERRNFYVACCAGMHRNTRYWEPCAIPFTYLYPEVRPRVKPSAAAAWDVPSGSLVEVVEEWVDCEHGTSRGFIKSKNLPSVASATSGDWLEVRDSFAGNDETCMRRHCEQDASAGNVVCFVPNGPKIVKMVDRWTECRWRGYKLFVKARHVQPAPAGASLDTVVHGGDSGKPGARAKAAAGAEAEPPAKRLKKGRPPCKYGAGCYQKNTLHRAKFSHPGDADFVPDASGVASASSSGGTPSASVGDKTGPVDSAPDVTMKEGSAADAELPGSVASAVSAVAAAPAGVPAGDASAPAPTVPEAKAPPEELHAPPAPPAAVPTSHSEAPAPGDAGAKESRDCDCCFDTVPSTDGVSCPGKAHFFCGPCLANFLEAFKTSEYAEQKKAKGRALCPMKDSDTPFGDGVLAAFVPQDVFDEYLQIRIKVAEQSIQEEFEKENSAKIEELKEKLAKATGSGEQLELDKHRLKIIDDIFTLKCPRCKMAFLDYDNCSAISCSACKCGFCSFCLEDCGKDAHSHFYKNGSKCPNEGGPLFVPHNVWQGYQNARKERLLCEYLAGLPDEMRKKVADLAAPDAKDLGIEMPQDLSAAGLMPEAHGIQRLKVTIPRRMRGLILPVKKDLPSKVELKIPEPSATVRLCSPMLAPIVAWKVTATSFGKSSIAAHLPADHQVKIEDEWVECRGLIKAKHIVGMISLGKDVTLKEANGCGSVLVRKTATQDEGKNALGYWDDGKKVKVVNHWIECSWEGAGPSKRGIVQANCIPENDIVLRGPEEDCQAVLKLFKAKLGFDVEVFSLGGAKPKAAGKAKAKAKAKGKAKAKAG